MKSIYSIVIVFLFFAIPKDLKAQDNSQLYVNVGYITNLAKCEDCKQADKGGSIRLGILTERRFGFYGGYLFFKEYHKDFIEYDDEGTLIVAGVDIKILQRDAFRLYFKFGMGAEKFTAIYPDRTESETNIKPDAGLLLDFKFLNAFIGWQPSDPPHFNVGVGVSIPL